MDIGCHLKLATSCLTYNQLVDWPDTRATDVTSVLVLVHVGCIELRYQLSEELG